jgi:hypothetical protein
MAKQFKISPLTPRRRAFIEEQRMRDVSAAFARLENTARPAWGPSAPDRLAYLQSQVRSPGVRSEL